MAYCLTAGLTHLIAENSQWVWVVLPAIDVSLFYFLLDNDTLTLKSKYVI